MNNELVQDEAKRTIKNSAGHPGLNWLYTKNYRLTTNWSSIQPKLSTILDFFMQNKANFKKVKFYVSREMKKNYEQMDTWSIRKNEPKTNPIRTQTNPIKANLNPKRTQNEPNFKTKSNPKTANQADYLHKP